MSLESKTESDGGGLSTMENIFYARTMEEVAHQVGYGGGLGLPIKALHLDLGFQKLDRDSVTHTTTFIVVHIHAEAPAFVLGDYQLRDHARTTLKKEGTDAFYRRCGDGFVAAERRGGLFLGIVALDEMSREDVARLEGNAGVSFLGVGVSANASRETREFFEQHNARYFVLQRGGQGGSGPGSVEALRDPDELLRRALAFKRGINEAPVLTRVVVKPYQVVSNQPRNADFLDVREQRRFIDDLAIEYGELKLAEAQAEAIAEDADCATVRKDAERAVAQYSKAKREVVVRAEDCLADPERKCHNRGLTFVDEAEHEKLLRSCRKTPTVARRTKRGRKKTWQKPAENDAGSGQPLKKKQRARFAKTPCKLWRFTQIQTRVASKKASGEAWDGDDSAPDVTVSVSTGGRNVASFPKKAGYSRTDSFGQPLYLDVGTEVSVSVVDRDVLADDTIGRPSGRVPDQLVDGAWSLQGGQASVKLIGQCVE